MFADPRTALPISTLAIPRTFEQLVGRGYHLIG